MSSTYNTVLGQTFFDLENVTSRDTRYKVIFKMFSSFWVQIDILKSLYSVSGIWRRHYNVIEKDTFSEVSVTRTQKDPKGSKRQNRPQCATMCHKVPQSATKCHRVPQSATKCHKRPQTATDGHRRPHSTTVQYRFYLIQ
jgi:hypothetical protein